MSPSVSPESQLDSIYPFNQYNTDFVKLDANNWQENSGQCNPPELSDFVCLKVDEEGVESGENKSFTDVTFIVGPPQHSKKYVGHRVLLAMTSPGKLSEWLSEIYQWKKLPTNKILSQRKKVFETMFYGDMADKSKYIRIPDVAPIGFENLLRYAYTDTLNLSSVEDSMLTAYAAKKYLLPQLLRECLNYIEHNITPSSACIVFEFAHVLNSQQLVLQAMELIDRETQSVIQSKSFNHIQLSTLEFLVNRKYLTMENEFILFKALLNWSMAELKRRQLDSNDWLSLRSILIENNVLSGIRFLAMTQEQFAQVVLKTSQLISDTKDPHQVQQEEEDRNEQQDGEERNNGQEGESIKRIDLSNENCLLTGLEQRAILFNLAMKNSTKLPKTINPATEARFQPPEYFTLKRFRSQSSANLVNTITTTKNIKSICSRFQCLNENIFLVALTIPIRLDASSYLNRTPKFECHLKFTTKAADASLAGTSQGALEAGSALDGGPLSAPLLMDTIDESLHISVSREKDCFVRLKRPILIRMNNVNELMLTFQTLALDEDVVVLRQPKIRASGASFSELVDGENVSWLLYKSSGIEFSELHYYY